MAKIRKPLTTEEKETIKTLKAAGDTYHAIAVM